MADRGLFENARSRWRDLQDRERLVLIIGAVALGLMLAYVLIWAPLSERREQLQNRVVERASTLNVVEQAADQVQALPAMETGFTGDDNSTSLLTQVDETARLAGLAAAIRSIEPMEEGVVRMQLDGAGFDELMAWLEQISTQRGIRVTEARLSRSDAPGEVDGRLQLSR